MDDVERILHAKEILEEQKEKLIKYYTEVYGKKYQSLIEERLNKTLYFFDSPPDITFDFFSEHQSAFNNTKEFDRLAKSAKQYKKLSKALIRLKSSEMFEVFCAEYNISPKQYRLKKYELLNLPLESFSTQNQAFLQNENISPTFKLEIIKAQEEYLTGCDNLGVAPLTNPGRIDLLLRYQALNNLVIQQALLIRSAWSKNFQKELLRITKSPIMYDQLYALICDNGMTGKFFQYRYSDNREAIPIVAIPLIEMSEERNLDRIFLHENRHAVEAGPNSAGIYNALEKRYQLLNEIRTEKGAIEDCAATDVIFSRSGCSKTEYEILFPLCGTLLEDYRNEFNECAITNDSKKLESIFGTEELQVYGRSLEDVYKVIKTGIASGENRFYIDSTEFLERFNTLTENAISNGYQPHQKVKR